MFRSSGRTLANRLLAAAALALLITAVAGCEAGNNAPTLEFHQAAAGAYADFNGISISNAFVLGAPSGSDVPAGSSASLFVSLFNNGTSGDALQTITAPGSASTVQLTGGTVALPGTSQVNLTGPEPKLVLSNLTKPLSGGQTIPITFTFEHAGSVTLQVPVEPHSFYYSTYLTPAPNPSGSATAKPKATNATATPPTSSATPPTATPTPST